MRLAMGNELLKPTKSGKFSTKIKALDVIFIADTYGVL